GAYSVSGVQACALTIWVCGVRARALGGRRRRPTWFFCSGRRRHTRSKRDWSSDVCSSDLVYLIETVLSWNQYACESTKSSWSMSLSSSGRVCSAPEVGENPVTPSCG